MEHKDEIISILENTDDEELIRYIYILLKRWD